MAKKLTHPFAANFRPSFESIGLIETILLNFGNEFVDFWQ